MYQKARIHGRDPAYDLSAEDDAVKKRRLHFGKCLREFLLDKYCMEGMSGADVAAISFFASEAGCLGVDDLSGLQARKRTCQTPCWKDLA